MPGEDDAGAPDRRSTGAAARCARASSLLAALRSRARRSRDALAQSRQKIMPRSTKAAPMMVPSAIRNVILRNGSPGSSQPIETKNGCSAQLIRPPVTAGMPMRAPTTMPAPKVEADSSIAPRSGTRTAARPSRQARGEAAAELAARSWRSSAGSVKRPQDVGHRQAGGKGQVHAVDQHRRVEHADARAEHADAQHVGHQLPGRRLRQAHPDHGLDQHAHAAHAGHRGGGGLDVVGAVLAVGAVAAVTVEPSRPASTWPPTKKPSEKFM